MKVRQTTALFLLGGCASMPQAFAQSSEEVRVHPLREAYFGDLHLHTSYSFDAYLGTNITPEQAYRFARGEPVDFLGVEVKRSAPPLDFLAITDHSENIGVAKTLDESASPLSQSELGKEARERGLSFVFRRMWMQLTNGRHGNLAKLTGVSAASLKATTASAWRRTIEAANQNYQPGTLTTFIAYEWSCMSNWRNLHRNVIFRGDDAPSPFTSIDSCRPEDLWAFLENVRKRGYEALAIPHNSNASNGLMFDWLDSDGNRVDRSYAELRASNEPLVEIYQIKGQSETHPALSPNDEFSNFEILDFLQGFRADATSTPGGSYVRNALGRGMEIARNASGANPFKYGFVGASDDHSGLSDSSEGALGTYSTIKASYLDWTSPLAERFKRARRAVADHSKSASQGAVDAALYALGSPGITGVWAEQNTRESIYAALRRKETFATSGTRLRLRFFGGWELTGDLMVHNEWVRAAYDGGVPMGADLPLPQGEAKKRAPKFAAWAVKDPIGANLDRLQVIKVSFENGALVEKIFDVALSNARMPNAESGKASLVGNTVEVENATYTNAIGATELSTVWEDPQFDPNVPSAYYLRVLEIPTPRHSTVTAVKHEQPLPVGVPLTIQERGWSSPIWYSPPAQPRG